MLVVGGHKEQKDKYTVTDLKDNAQIYGLNSATDRRDPILPNYKENVTQASVEMVKGSNNEMVKVVVCGGQLGPQMDQEKASFLSANEYVQQRITNCPHSFRKLLIGAPGTRYSQIPIKRVLIY